MGRRERVKIRSICLTLVMVMIMTLVPMATVYGEVDSVEATEPAAETAIPETVDGDIADRATVPEITDSEATEETSEQAAVEAEKKTAPAEYTEPTVEEEVTPAATYNGVAYETLEAAVEAVDDTDSAKDTVVLERDVLIDGVKETGYINKNIILDLNGKTISGSVEGALIRVSADKSISLRKGTITNTSDAEDAIAVSGTVKVPRRLAIAPAGTWKTAKSIEVIDKVITAKVTMQVNGRTSSAGGTVEPNPPAVIYGQDLVIDIVPNPGYEVRSVIVNGIYKGKENQVTLTKVTRSQNVIIDFVPRNIYIMLDPGHGSKEINRVGNYQEHKRMWVLTKYLQKELEKFLGFAVDLTKQKEAETPGVYLRGQRAQGYDMLISMHSNWSGDGSVDYPLAIVSSGSALNAKARPLGTTLASVVQNTMGTRQRSQVWTRKQSDGTDWYGVIRGAASVGTPSVILEHSFHSNKKARNWLMSNSNLRKMAVAEAKAIAKHYGLTKKARTTTVTYSPKKKGVTLRSMVVRKSPSTSVSGIGRFSSGINIKVDALVIAPDGTAWYKVYTNKKYGYILQKDVKLTADKRQTAKYVEYSSSKRANTSRYMIVRANHASTSSEIGTFRKGTTIKVNGLYTATNGVQWYKVRVSGKDGYVLAKYVTLK